MLSPNDYNHLKLLYEKFEKSNSHIKSLITEMKWDDVDVAVQEKDNILRQIIFFEKPRLDDIKENKELNSIRLNLIELEKQNIELVKSLREQIKNDLVNVKKNKKLISAYEPSVNDVVSTYDIKE